MRSVTTTAVPQLARRAILQSDLAPVLLAGDVAAFAIAREILGYGAATSYIQLLAITLGISVCVHAYRPLEALVLLSALVAVRSLMYTAIRAARIRGLITHPVVLVGNGTLTWRPARIPATHREYGLRPVGVLDDDPMQGDDNSPLHIVDGPTILPKILAQHWTQHVIVSFGGPGDNELVEAAPLVRVRSSYGRRAGRIGKRSFELVVAVAGLLTMAPVMALVALAVSCELGRGVIFRQERIGQHRKRFMLLKSRSLRPVDPDESDMRWSIDEDPGLGPVGRFIRATSLDELPQLWNMLRGDMSIVGPRPERPFYVDRFGVTVPRYVARHRFPAGLTGWAQTHGLRGHTSIEDRVRFDNTYIQRWSFRVDLAILLCGFSHLVCMSTRHISVRMSSPASCRPSRRLQRVFA